MTEHVKPVRLSRMQALARIRQMRGLTQHQLSAKTKGLITRDSIAQYETGRCYPTDAALVVLAIALDVNTTDLLRRE